MYSIEEPRYKDAVLTQNLKMNTLTLTAWTQYYQLTKPKVVFLIIFTAMVGMLLAADGTVPLKIFVFGLLGIGLAAASGAAINHVVDEHIDRIMERTRNRPLASGELSQKTALIFAVSIGALGILMLVVFVNMIVWGFIWGPMGMILSTPILACLKAVLAHTNSGLPFAQALENK